MEVLPQETETVDDGAHVEDRLPSCCLTSAFATATARLPAAMEVAAKRDSDPMLGHLEELSACLDAACQGHVDEAMMTVMMIVMWRAAHAAKEITPSSPPIKDLAQSVRNIVLCHILSTVGYTSRARVEAKICAIFGVERLNLLDEVHGHDTEALVWQAYSSLVGKLPGAIPSNNKASGRPARAAKQAAKEACTQTDEATCAQTGEETPASGFFCLFFSI